MISFKKKLLIFLILIFVLAPFGNCLAQEPIALEISPLKDFYSLEPGQNQIGQLFIRNGSSISLKIKPRVVSFTTIDDAGTLQIEEGDFNEFVSVPISVFELVPGQKRQISYEVRAPSNAVGGNYFAILFATEPLEKEDGTLVSGEVGSLIFLEVLGEIKHEVEIKSFNVKKINWNEPLFEALLANTGNTHVTPFGEIVILNWRGKEKDDIIVNYPTILPGKERKMSFEPNRNLFGKYTAKFNIIDENWELVSEEKVFWVFAWEKVLMLLQL
jgi:hypothetical protein